MSAHSTGINGLLPLMRPEPHISKQPAALRCHPAQGTLFEQPLQTACFELVFLEQPSFWRLISNQPFISCASKRLGLGGSRGPSFLFSLLLEATGASQFLPAERQVGAKEQRGGERKRPKP